MFLRCLVHYVKMTKFKKKDLIFGKKLRSQFFKNPKKLKILKETLIINPKKQNLIYNIPQNQAYKLTLTQKVHKLEQISETLFQKLSIAIGQVYLIPKQSATYYQCEHCGKCFIKACALGGHVARVHKESGLQQYYMKNEKRSKKQISFYRSSFEKQKNKKKNQLINNVEELIQKKKEKQTQIKNKIKTNQKLNEIQFQIFWTKDQKRISMICQSLND